jgi:hypothetical protein
VGDPGQLVLTGGGVCSAAACSQCRLRDRLTVPLNATVCLVTPNPTPDPDATIHEAQAIAKALTDFHAIAVAHDSYGAAAHVENVRETLDRVIQLQSWLQHYSDALRLRAR